MHLNFDKKQLTYSLFHYPILHTWCHDNHFIEVFHHYHEVSVALLLIGNHLRKSFEFNFHCLVRSSSAMYFPSFSLSILTWYKVNIHPQTLPPSMPFLASKNTSINLWLSSLLYRFLQPWNGVLYTINGFDDLLRNMDCVKNVYNFTL